MIRRIATLIRRSGRFVAASLIIVAVWGAWAMWPPSPVFTFTDVVRVNSVVLHGTAVVAVEDRPDDATKVEGTGPHPKVVTVINISTGRRKEIRLPPTTEVAIAPDGLHAAVRPANGRIQLMDLGRDGGTVNLPVDASCGIEWSPDARLVALMAGGRVVVIRAADAATVADLPSASNNCRFLPDSTGIGYVSADGLRFEICRFEPRSVESVLDLPCRAVPTRPVEQVMPPPDTGMVMFIKFSRDGDTVVVTFDRVQKTEGRPALVTTAEVARRSTGLRQSFAFGSCYLRGRMIDPVVSNDGRWLYFGKTVLTVNHTESVLGLLENEPVPPAPLWDLSRNPPVSATPVAREVPGVEPIPGLERKDLYLLGSQRMIVNLEGERLLIDPPGEKVVSRWSPDTGFWSANTARTDADERWLADSLTYPRPEWLPMWLPQKLVDAFYPGDSATGVIRLSDGRCVRMLPGRWPYQFDAQGYLWTVRITPINKNGILERWSPEPAQPWWPIAGTVLAAGVALWPRFRRSQNAIVAGARVS